MDDEERALEGFQALVALQALEDIETLQDEEARKHFFFSSPAGAEDILERIARKESKYKHNNSDERTSLSEYKHIEFTFSAAYARQSGRKATKLEHFPILVAAQNSIARDRFARKFRSRDPILRLTLAITP